MKRFPFYKQLDQMDCGSTCLRMVARFYGRMFNLAQIRSLTYASREGVSLLSLSEASEKMGFRSSGVKISWAQLTTQAPLPCIVHWNQNHFVVVVGVKKKGGFFSRKGLPIIQVADPAYGMIDYSKEEFMKHWSANGSDGIALILEPTPSFYQDDEETSSMPKFAFLFNYLRPYRRFLVQLFIGLFVGSVVSMIFPFLTQSIVDYGIGNSDLGFIAMVLTAQLVLTFGQTANEIIRSWLMLHVSTRVSISLISDFLIKMMRLPISFFDSRMVGDIMQRIGDHSRIQTFLTSSLISILFAIVSFFLYAIVMATYHPLILLVFAIGSVLYIGWVLLFLKKRRNIDYSRFQQASANQSNIVQLITGMQDIKLNNCEKQKRWEWERIQAKLYKVNLRGLMLTQNQMIGAAFINQTKDILISFLTARAVVSGEMTLGMMMAVQYMIGQLNGPIQQFIGFIQSAQDAKISLERLGEINDREDEEQKSDRQIRDIPVGKDIELKNVMFQYEGPNSPKVLDEINLVIPANKLTAIVGTSGSGKSTLLKLLLGFYQPVRGEICLAGISLDAYDQQNWRRHCGVVMQDGFIFSDSIGGNIAVGDPSPDPTRLELAAKVANISDYIHSLPLGLETRIGSDGHGISTGQKQRFLIARSVYKNPDYIFFDEATNALDARNELIIMDRLNQFFQDRTVVVVAHRLSTVKRADNIVVLEDGRIMEQGTHEQLVQRKGIYFHLVKDQLELGN